MPDIRSCTGRPDPGYLPYVSTYERKPNYRIMCGVCGTEYYSDDIPASCDACGCNDMTVEDLTRPEYRISLVKVGLVLSVFAGYWISRWLLTVFA